MSKHEPMAQVAENFVFFLRSREDATRWPVGTKLYAESPLIAAAPELLAALRKCADQLEMITGKVHEERAALIEARAAIAKATGEQA